MPTAAAKSRNTSRSYLMISSDGTSYSKLIDVKEIPAYSQAPNMLDDTTLSDLAHTYTPDILDSGGGLEFTANWTKENVQALDEVAGEEKHYAIYYGAQETTSGGTTTLTPDGHDGIVKFKGILSYWSDAVSVGAVHDLKFSIAPSTAPEVSFPS